MTSAASFSIGCLLSSTNLHYNNRIEREDSYNQHDLIVAVIVKRKGTKRYFVVYRY